MTLVKVNLLLLHMCLLHVARGPFCEQHSLRLKECSMFRVAIKKTTNFFFFPILNRFDPFHRAKSHGSPSYSAHFSFQGDSASEKRHLKLLIVGLLMFVIILLSVQML